MKILYVIDNEKYKLADILNAILENHEGQSMVRGQCMITDNLLKKYTLIMVELFNFPEYKGI